MFIWSKYTQEAKINKCFDNNIQSNYSVKYKTSNYDKRLRKLREKIWSVRIMGSGGMKGGDGWGGRRFLFLHETEPERQNKGDLLFILKLEQLGAFPSRSLMNRLLDRCHWKTDNTLPPNSTSPSPPSLLQWSDGLLPPRKIRPRSEWGLRSQAVSIDSRLGPTGF